MTSKEFLSRIGVSTWAHFAFNTPPANVLRCYSPTERPELFEGATAPLSVDDGRVVGRLGYVGDRLYVGYFDFRLTPTIVMVAAVYKPSGTSFNECDVYFFRSSSSRQQALEQTGADDPEVVGLLAETKSRRHYNRAA